MMLVTLAVGAVISTAADALPHAVEHQIRAHERLHYGLHLAAGRALGLCPCTRAAAQSQYAKAQPHAHTPRQRALVTTQVPQTAADYTTDALLLLGLSLWAGVAHPVGQWLLLTMVTGTGLLLMVRALRRRRSSGSLR